MSTRLKPQPIANNNVYSVFVTAAFAFGGTELVGLAAAEAAETASTAASAAAQVTETATEANVSHSLTTAFRAASQTHCLLRCGPIESH